MATWVKQTWTSQSSPSFTGKAVEINNRLLLDEMLDYKNLKLALLARYDFTERRYREQVFEA